MIPISYNIKKGEVMASFYFHSAIKKKIKTIIKTTSPAKAYQTILILLRSKNTVGGAGFEPTTSGL